jgi:hypothetical protein
VGNKNLLMSKKHQQTKSVANRSGVAIEQQKTLNSILLNGRLKP